MIIYQLGLILKLGKVRAQREELKAAQVKPILASQLYAFAECAHDGFVLRMTDRVF